MLNLLIDSSTAPRQHLFASQMTFFVLWINIRKSFSYCWICRQFLIQLTIKLFCNVWKLLFGIKGPALAWLQSYFRHCHQRVLIDNVQSNPITVTRGSPQGSVLGPLALIMYSSPLEDIVKVHFLQRMIYTGVYHFQDRWICQHPSSH